MIADNDYKKPEGQNGRRVLLVIVYLTICAGGLVRDAEACFVTEVNLWVRRLEEDEWGFQVTICKGETAYFKAECQVEEDLKRRPIKWKISYGDETTDTLWTDNPNSGPESGGTYSVRFEHTFTESNDDENQYYTVKVEAQRVDPVTGSAIADWIDDGCKVTVLGMDVIKYQEGSKWIDRDVCVTKGTNVTFKAFPTPSSYTWPPDKPDWTVSDVDAGTGETMSYTFNELGDYIVKANCCDSYYLRVVHVKEVKFVEDATQSYGFDDWSGPQQPHKSLKKHETDTDKAKAEIVTDPVDNVHFKSVISGKVTVIPTQASTTPQPLTFNSNELTPGSSSWEVQAYKYIGTVPTPLAKLSVKVYNETDPPLSVKVIAVWEDNDDEQVIDPGEGPEPGGSPLCIKSLSE